MTYRLLNIIPQLLAKHTFLGDLKDEFREIGELIMDFFLMIKEYTYDLLADQIGSDIVNIMLIALGTIGIMILLITIINR